MRRAAKKSKVFCFFFSKKKAFLLFYLAIPPAYGEPAAVLRAHDWAGADALAQQTHDPLAVKLVQFLRLHDSGAADAVELNSFITANPTWPDQGILRRRLGEAVAGLADDSAARAICAIAKPTLDIALLRCAQAERAAGHFAPAGALARRAWIAGLANPTAEAAFLHDWPAAADDAANWERFDALDWANDPAAERQADRVAPARRPLARARLAFRRNDRAALDLLGPLSPQDRTNPALNVAEARYLRGQNDNAAVLALWHFTATEAERNAPPEHRAAFWNERDRLARALLAKNDEADAEAAAIVASDPNANPDQAPDSLFLTGWILLRRLHDPVRATAQFQALAASSPAVITQGRAYYWLGRAAPTAAAARAAYTRAAAYPTTYYGQLALQRLGQQVAPRLLAIAEPTPTDAAEKAYASNELVRAADILAGWGDVANARTFLLHQARAAHDVATTVLTARHANTLGIPDVAVAAARMAGRLGTALPQLGWPAPYHPPPGVDAALMLGLMRQESSFDPAVVSSAGAIGLTQLLPGTARLAQPGLVNAAAVLTNPGENMRLGVAYMRTLLDEFRGVKAYALAGYNAGPRRPRAWIATNGDAAGDPEAMIDWIELIPFQETRNYVQRVLEGEAIYNALETK
jgi:soluble lytic murein transglycosylase